MIMTLCLKALGMFQRPHHDKCLQSEDQICKQENGQQQHLKRNIGCFLQHQKAHRLLRQHIAFRKRFLEWCAFNWCDIDTLNILPSPWIVSTLLDILGAKATGWFSHAPKKNKESSPRPNAWGDSKMHHYRFAHQLSGHLSYTAKTYRGVNLHKPMGRTVYLPTWMS